VQRRRELLRRRARRARRRSPSGEHRVNFGERVWPGDRRRAANISLLDARDERGDDQVVHFRRVGQSVTLVDRAVRAHIGTKAAGEVAVQQVRRPRIAGEARRVLRPVEARRVERALVNDGVVVAHVTLEGLPAGSVPQRRKRDGRLEYERGVVREHCPRDAQAVVEDDGVLSRVRIARRRDEHGLAVIPSRERLEGHTHVVVT
jgi:hypothetical protein